MPETGLEFWTSGFVGIVLGYKWQKNVTIMAYSKRVSSGGRWLLIFAQWSVAQQCQGQCYFFGRPLVCVIAAISLTITFAFKARRRVEGKGREQGLWLYQESKFSCESPSRCLLPFSLARTVHGSTKLKRWWSGWWLLLQCTSYYFDAVQWNIFSQFDLSDINF